MGQGYSQTLPPGPGAIEAPDLTDLTFEKSLGGARFLRTIRARHENGIVVVKVCQKIGPSVSFRDYAAALQEERQQLQNVPNVLVYQRIRETSTHGILVRQFINSSLYDRISIRPFLESIEKKWIAFQLLSAVRDCHSRGIFHGDIKTENVLVTSWGWVLLTDFASAFKPVYLPEDNPAEFSFFYDTSARRTCYLAPERFLTTGKTANEGNVVQWNMDIFSLGCVLAELFTEAPTFTLTQLFRYRRGEYDPTLSLLDKIDESHVRTLISSMIRADPSERWHAQDYLDEYKSKVFPVYFYQHLHALMQDITDPTPGRKQVSSSKVNNGESDDRIERIYQDFEMLSVSLGYPPTSPSQPLPTALPDDSHVFPLQVDIPNSRHTADGSLATIDDNGTLILLNVITSSIRSAARASSKIKACELLLAFSERLPDEAKLDRVLPYLTLLLEDTADAVLIAALRTITQLLSLVKVATPINSFLFTQYIFPRLQALVASKTFRKSPLVRATYAACLASLAQSTSRFLDIMRTLRTDGSLRSVSKGDEDVNGETPDNETYDAARAEVIQQLEAQTKVLLTDSEVSVRRALLGSVPGLCIFFGENRAADIILSHLNTYLNDPDWQLKRAFFKTMVGVAISIGGASLEEFILPLIVGALTDPQEFVVEQAIRSLASLAELGLLQRPRLWELIDLIARFTVHPDIWIKEAATHFISAATTYLSITDVRVLVMPLVQPYLKVPVSACSEYELLDALKKPLPRAVLDLAIAWAQKTDRGLFWKPAKESRQLFYRGSNIMPPVSSVADIGPRSLGRTPKTDEDEQWLGRLRNAGMRTEDEMKLLALREYIWRVAQKQSRDGNDKTDSQLNDHIRSLNGLGIRPQTVIFESSLESYSDRLRMQEERTIAEALEEAVTPMNELTAEQLQVVDRLEDQEAATAKEIPIRLQSPRIPGLRKYGSGSLSSSPNSAIGLLGRDADRTVQHKASAIGLITGADVRNKASAEVATDDATAAGRLDSHATNKRANTGPAAARRDPAKALPPPERAHNYDGNDPSVLKLLDAIYVDTFPIDVAEFGPVVQPLKRGSIPSTAVVSTPNKWKPHGQLVAVLAEHTGSITRIVVAPDHTFFLTGSEDGTVKIWDGARLERNVTHRARQTHRLGTGVKVTSLCFIEMTHCFVCTGSDGCLQVVKVEVSMDENVPRYGKLRVLREWQIPEMNGQGEHCVWSEHYRVDSASTLVLLTSLGRVISVDLKSMTINYEIRNPAQHGVPTCFCIGRKKDWLLIGTEQGVLDLWDLRFRLRLRSWTFHQPSPITRLQIHPSRKTARRNRICMAGGTSRDEMTVWDIEKLICYEVYRPAHHHSQEKLNPRQYEMKALDDDRAEALLQHAVEDSRIQIDASASGARTTMQFGQQYSTDDSDAAHGFLVSGGPDGNVRFWDCDRLDACRIVSSGGADADAHAHSSHTYTYTQLSMDTRLLAEHVVADEPPSTEAAHRASSGKKAAPNRNGLGKPSRFDTIRESARSLLHGHLDSITDVGLLERPFGMVLSADRSGLVFVHQ